MKYDRKLFKFNSRKARRHFLNNRVRIDPYNGRQIDHNQKWDVEHLYPLELAWETGFKDMYKEDPERTLIKMKQFSNDMQNLVPVWASSNRSRGSKTLWEYLPLNLAWIPERNKRVRSLARRYNLTMTKQMIWSMDWADKKLEKHKRGIKLNVVRLWLINRGFYSILLPF